MSYSLKSLIHGIKMTKDLSSALPWEGRKYSYRSLYNFCNVRRNYCPKPTYQI